MKQKINIAKKFVQVIEDGKLKCLYDLYKVSSVFRIDNVSLKIIIGGVENTWNFSDKENCDKNFNFLIEELAKLNETED